MKPFFETTEVKLYQGDCLTILPTLEASSIDAVICDLPYGTTKCSWDVVIPFEPLWEQYRRLVKPNGAIVLFGSQPFTTDLINSNRSWFKYEWIWEKPRATGFLNASNQPLKAHENIVVFSSSASTFSRMGSMKFNPQLETGVPYTKRPGKAPRSKLFELNTKTPDKFRANKTSRSPRSVIQFSTGHNGAIEHGTQKPIDLLEYLVKTYTCLGDRVLDNTAGSFTAGVAAVLNGRHFVGIEREEKYCAIGRQRIEDAIAEIDSMLIKPWEIEPPIVVEQRSLL